MFLQNLKNNINIKLFVTILILFLYDFNNNLELTNFNSNIGIATVLGLDIGKRIFNHILYIIQTALIFFLINLGVNFFTKNKLTGETVSALKFFNLAIYALIFPFIVFFIGSNESILAFKYIILYILIAISFSLIYIRTFNFHRIKLDNFLDSILFSTSLTLVLRFLYNKNDLYDSLLIFIFGFLILSINFFVYISGKFKVKFQKLISENLSLSSILPLVVFVLVEVINIYTQWGIELFSKKYAATLILISFIVLFSASILLKVQLFFFSKYKLQIFTLGTLLLAFGPNYTLLVANNELFESANHGLQIYEFFKFNKIPLIDNFDAHMLSISAWGIIYGILTKDYTNAIFAPYLFLSTVIPIFLLFILLKDLFNKYFVVIILIFLPYSGSMNNSIFYLVDLTIISIIATINAIRRNSYFSYLLMLLSFVFSFMYRLDSGFASISSSLILVFLSIVKKKTKIKDIIKPFFHFVIISLFLMISFVYFKNIDLYKKFIEFKDIASSNQVWGYETIGNDSLISYKVGYYLLPSISTLALIFLIIKFLKIKNDYLENFYLVTISFGLMYLLNIPRSVVRHSIHEDAIGVVYGTAFIFLCLYASLTKISKKELVFSITLSLSFLFIQINHKKIILDDSIFGNLHKKYETGIYFQNNNLFKDRVDKKNLKDVIEESQVIKQIIPENSTYVDFTNDTLLYTLVEREKPVYINQSPGLLSGVVSQSQFIEQIKNDKNANFLLKSNYCKSMDYVNYELRHYEVSSYLNKNFSPKYLTKKYQIWVKDNTSLNQNSNYILDNYAPTCRKYNLGQVPFYFSYYTDLKNPVEVFQESKNINNIDLNFSRSKNFTYFVELYLKSDKESNVNIRLSKLDSKEPESSEVIFTFNTQKNVDQPHKYIIPISIEYVWYDNSYNSIRIDSDSKSTQLLNFKIYKL